MQRYYYCFWVPEQFKNCYNFIKPLTRPKTFSYKGQQEFIPVPRFWYIKKIIYSAIGRTQGPDPKIELSLRLDKDILYFETTSVLISNGT